MPVIPIVSFRNFIEIISGSIRANKNLKNDREYKIKVGLIGKQFKVDKWGEFARNIDSELKDWISHIKTHFGEAWPHVNNPTLQGLTDLTKGTARVIHAYAIHYRLHAELDRPQFARKIDEFVFGGENFEQYHGSAVFYKQEREEKQIRATFAKLLMYPDAYQRGRKEFNEVKSALIMPNGSQNAVSVAICGAGGYGKSSLAQEICDDEGIQKAFPGGIYWLQFGLLDNSKENSGGIGLAKAIDRMLDAQYDKSEQPPLDWGHKDSDILKLIEILPGERVLLVTDDLGTPQQLSWLSQVSANVSVLMTTRRGIVAKQAAHEITIQRLTHEASYKLLTHGMTNISPNQQKRFQELAKGFGGWPLLLGLANGVFKQRGGDPKARIDWSLGRFEQFLADDEIDAWDIPESDEKAIKKRQKFVGFCIEAGLRAIHPSNNPDLLRKLAIFSADADIPFSVTIDYWAKIENKRISKSRGEALLRHFADFSFFSSFNENTQSLRLHDEILGYFRARASEDQRRWLHGELLASIQAHCSRGWETLPQNHTYGWMQLLHHLEKADRSDQADDLRTDFRWLKAKLASVGASELQRSFRRNASRNDAKLVGQAIKLSASVLSKRPNALAHQLFGRLGQATDLRLLALAQAAKTDQKCYPTPVNPHLLPVGPELQRFIGHLDGVDSAAFDGTGARLVTASRDQSARVWDCETGVQIGEPLRGNSHPVIMACFNQRGDKIITISGDKTARLWDAKSGFFICKLIETHSSGSCIVAPNQSGSIGIVEFFRRIEVWNFEDDAPIGRPINNDYLIDFIDIDASGRRLIIALYRQAALVWDVEAGTPICKLLDEHPYYVESAAFDPKGRWIVTTSSDRPPQVWDARTGAPIGQPLEGHSAPILGASFDPSGRMIVTTSEDRTARVWDAETGSAIGKPLGGNSDWVVSAAFDPSGDKVVTALNDCTARVWDTKTSRPIGDPFVGHNGRINSVGFDPSGRKVVTISDDGTARLWNADSEESLRKPYEGHVDRVTSAAFDPSGRRIVTASKDQTARLWGFETGAPIGKPLEGHTGAVIGAAFINCGRSVLTVSKDHTACLWDAKAGVSTFKSLEKHAGIIKSVAFDRSGRRIVTISDNFTAWLWNAQTLEPIGELIEGNGGFVTGVALDAVGSRVITLAHRIAQVWNVASGAAISKPLEGHTAHINGAAFDPSGRRVVTASNDQTARVWNAETGAPIGLVLQHDGLVQGATFDSTGNKIATVSNDKTARLWDANTSACLAIIDFDYPACCVSWHNECLVVGLSSGLLCFFMTEISV